jgi:hypothetical protein
MSLNDVWRNINQEIGIFWKGRWSDVPHGPGVYGWFYPLRIVTYDLQEFLLDLQTVFSFDAISNGKAHQSLSVPFAWHAVQLDVGVAPSSPQIPRDAAALWAAIVSDPIAFERLRRVVMRGSLLMPPLYVGKAKSLSVRCQQHLAGTGGNDFHRRYTEFAVANDVRARSVNDLLFACIRTTTDRPSHDDDAIEGLVEEILKRACQPRYSLK